MAHAKAKAHTVKAVSKLAGVSVRTLHHYDEIGLLKPSSHSAAGYRLYQEKDLERLQQVLFFRELGFDLKEIKRIVDDPDFDRRAALLEHRKLLLERQERFGRLIQSVDRTLKAMQRGIPMNAKMFDGFDQAALQEEARQRWGGSPAWEQSEKRWNSYTDTDKGAMQREGQAIIDDLVALMDRDPADPDVQAVIARHHAMICKWFFDCPKSVYRQIGEGYVDDPRFTAYWDGQKPGLAVFVRDAIRPYTDSP